MRVTVADPTVAGRWGVGVSRRKAVLLVGEVTVMIVLVVVVGVDIHAGLAETRSGGGEVGVVSLVVAVGAEGVSLGALPVVTRRLLASLGYRLAWRPATSVALASNAISVLVPGGAAAAPVWAARQYQHRRVPVTAAAWTVVASGFASTIVLVVLLVVGAGIARVVGPLTAVAVGAVAIVGAGLVVWLVHRAPRLLTAGPRNPPGRWGRLVVRAAEMGQWRAGWTNGSVVVAASALNWLADAGVLASVFVFCGQPVPWAGLLFAYCVSQAAGALIPLPGGLGAVEGGLFGALLLVGAASSPTLEVVAMYRLLGYWLPAAAGIPAYVLARRHDTRGHDTRGCPVGPGDRTAVETVTQESWTEP
jgi:putative heme transporter